MAILKVLEYPDPKLRNKALPVENFDKEISQFVDDMFATMYDSPNCAGLAAIQVGVKKRVIVIDEKPKGKPKPMYFINPEILKTEGQATNTEGCVSVPDSYFDVTRPAHIWVKYQDKEGNVKELDTGGFLSYCLQHEIDHLNGVLFIDRLSSLKREKARRAYMKARKQRRI